MSRRALWILGLLLVVGSGCQRKLPATIEGVITMDGQALPNESNTTGEVMFYPTGGGAAAYAPITAGGKYSVNTGGTKGLEPGEYKVTVRVVEVPPEPPGGYQNAPAQKVISPSRYQDREKSGLVKQIDAGKNIVDLDLQSQ